MTETETMILRRAQQSLGCLAAEARSNLVRLSAAYADNHVSWQVVVLDQADEEEIEEYACIFTEVLADFHSATGDETLIRVQSNNDVEADALPIVIYS